MMNEKQHRNFWKKINIGNPDECWKWSASKLKAGYGVFKLDGKMQLAHRIMFQIHNSDVDIDIPDPTRPGFLISVMHTCDHPWCVNPKHLKLGTQVDNMQDRDRKGRGIKGHTWNRGEKHGRSKLTWAKVRDIRQSDKTSAELAKEYGVNKSTIYRIINNEYWKG